MSDLPESCDATPILDFLKTWESSLVTTFDLGKEVEKANALYGVNNEENT